MMVRKLFLILIFICFSGLVLAAAPDVNFTFTPANPNSNQLITFNPDVNYTGTINNMRWMFGSDGNTNSFASYNVVLDDNFLVDFTGWTQSQGSYSISSNLLTSTSTDASLTHPIVYPDANANIYINVQMKLNTTGITEVCFNEHGQTTGGVCTNYGLWLREPTAAEPGLKFYHSTNSIITIDANADVNVLHDVNVIRTSDGNFSFYLDGVYKASVVDNTSPIDGNFAALIYLDNAAGFGQWGYTQFISSFVINPDLNQTHTFTTGGNQNVCLTSGNDDGNTTACNIVTVSGVAPTVTFTMTPTSANAFQSILFNPDINANGTINNLRWNFDSDGNVNYFAPPPITIDMNETHTFTTGGTKVICLTAGNNDSNVTFCNTIAIAQILGFKVFDENTHQRVPFPIALVDGNTFTGDASGNLSIVSPTVSHEAIIAIYATNYPPRYFTYLLDINASFQSSIYLLDLNKGRNIEFVVRDENATKYPNKFFEIQKDGNVVSRVYLDDKSLSAPLYLATLTSEYNWFVDQNSSGTLIFDYNNSNLQILVPKNEATLETITPFGIQLSDITAIDINNLSVAQVFRIYPNTFHPYHITIDANNLSYFERYYDVRARGRQSNVLLQPYMLRAVDNGIPATMILKNSLSSISLQYYLFEFLTDVDSTANVLVESPQTDSAGTFIFTTVTGKNYFLKIYDPYGDLVKQGQFVSSTSNQYFLDLFTGVLSNIDPTIGTVDINLTIPQHDFFFLNDSNNFGMVFFVTSTGPSISSVNVLVTNDGTTLHNQTFTPSFPAVVFPSGTEFDANFFTSLNNINARVLITVTSSAGLVTRTYQFPLRQDSNPTVSFPGFDTFCSNVGQLGCSLIWLFIGLLLSIGLRFNPVFGVDNNGMFWVMAIWTGIAAFIGLVPYTIGFIAILAGASLWAIRNRPLG